MIGFDIGGTKCAVSVGEVTDGGIRIAGKKVIPTDHTVPPEVMVDRMVALSRELTKENQPVGISCGGPLNSRTGEILSPPNLPGWDRFGITGYLSEKYGIRAALCNDANACALAEWRYGAGQGTQSMIFLTFGTGLGAGLILDGKLYNGITDTAGEVGHFRLAPDGPVGYGKAGSFEGFCSGSGIATIGKAYAAEALRGGKRVSFCPTDADLKSITAQTIAKCADAGEEDALRIYRDCGKRLGEGIAVLIDVLNPECVVIGSIYQRAEHLLREPVMEAIRREALPIAAGACRILPAKLKENLGDVAALCVAAEVGTD